MGSDGLIKRTPRELDLYLRRLKAYAPHHHPSPAHFTPNHSTLVFFFSTSRQFALTQLAVIWARKKNSPQKLDPGFSPSSYEPRRGVGCAEGAGKLQG